MTSGPLVVKIGGTTLEEQSASPGLWKALVRAAAERPEGVLLVHGGGKAVDRLIARLGLPSERRDGIRITPPDQIKEIAAVLAGAVNKGLVATVNAAGGRAVGLCLGDGNAIRTEKTTRFSFDPGLVGDVLPGGDPALLRTLLREKFLPVMSSIGIDSQGRMLNVNADDAAAGIASLLGASALVLMTDVPGILGADKQVIREIDAAGIEKLIESGVIHGGMIPKTRAAAATARMCGAPVVILNGNDPEGFVRFLSGAPVGSRIVSPA